MAKLINSDLDVNQRKLLFVSGAILSLASDMQEHPTDPDAPIVGRMIQAIVLEALNDVTSISVDPVNPQDDLAAEQAELHATLKGLILAGN